MKLWLTLELLWLCLTLLGTSFLVVLLETKSDQLRNSYWTFEICQIKLPFGLELSLPILCSDSSNNSLEERSTKYRKLSF